MDTKIHSISILGGVGKNGDEEPVRRVDFNMGNIISIVGPTGSGKTTLINEMQLFTDGFTPTKRRILINGAIPPPEYQDDPSCNPVAAITQHTNFLSDLPVGEFLRIHVGIRHSSDIEIGKIVDETLSMANHLTGEPIIASYSMTELSGGQTRALLIADAVVVGNSPIILLDEIENAGIYRGRALDILRKYQKIFVFVTHDPYIALLSDIRIVMKKGMMIKKLQITEDERTISKKVKKLDDILHTLKEKIRLGDQLVEGDWEAAI
jgi:ABC-type lipoprotein export system ATPase subunit